MESTDKSTGRVMANGTKGGGPAPVLRLLAKRSLTLAIIGGGERYGTLSGFFDRAGAFRIRGFSLRDEAMDNELMRRALREMILSLPSDTRTIWEYSIPKDKTYRAAAMDPRYRLMKSALLALPEYEATWSPCGSKYRVDMTALPENIRSRTHYTEAQMAADRMTFLPITEMDRHEEEIRALMEADPQAARMGPLYEENFDPELSFLSLWRGEIVGWMLLRRESPEEVHIFRFYAAKKYRAQAGGARTSAHMIRSMEGKCRWLSFVIMPSEASNARFYARFFGSAMETIENRYRTEAGKKPEP